MNKVLRKRVLRDLKKNFFRYLALALLITFGMYIVVSMVGSAETIIRGTKYQAEIHNVEDGQFQLFVPLKDEEISQLENKGITLEKMFYLDFKSVNDSTVRIFKNREQINLVNVDEGKIAQSQDEIVVEKRFCQENNFNIGDNIKVGNVDYKIVGICTSPDYDAPFENMNDMVVDSTKFGVGFVTEQSYDNLNKQKLSVKSEEYVYSYLLNEKITDNELREILKDYKVSADSIEDEYFQEYWDKTGGKIQEMLDGVKELADGSKELTDGLNDIEKNSNDIRKGINTLFSQYLKEAQSSLTTLGITETLTEDNFSLKINSIKSQSDNAILNMSLTTLNETLSGIKKYKDGIDEYTKAVASGAEGSDELYENLKRLDTEINKYVDENIDIKINNLISLTPKGENPRIGAAADDEVINKMAGLFAGVILIMLFAYVISVFVIHSIEQENAVIGALYALGVRRKDLMIHYLTLPVIVTFIGGLVGTLIGVSNFGIGVMMESSYGYFSVPKLAVSCPIYVYIYGLVVPPVIAIIVNFFVIKKQLYRNVLSLMRGEVKEPKTKTLRLKNMSFIRAFQIKQMRKELRTGFTVIIGMFISLLIVMLSVDCYTMCNHISEENKADTKYEYMYTYKYPDSVAPKDSEPCFAKTFKKEAYGYNMDVTLLGIDESNPYFDAKVSKSESKVVISSAMSQKYNLKIGETFIVDDEENGRYYAFEVEDITQFSTGLFMFMDIDSMRELYGESNDYFNVVFSDKELPIEKGKLYSTVSKDIIAHSSSIFVEQMQSMIIMLIVVSILIFSIVMYLMMKVMVERASLNISLLEIFGYRMKELKKLYLNANLYIVIIGAIICIPLSKLCMDKMYPYMVANVATAMNLNVEWWIYVALFGAIILLYFLINSMLVRKLKKIIPAQVLKNRE